jgi:hypothetical protein
MTIIVILAAWVGISILACLALAGAAARSKPHFLVHGADGHGAATGGDNSGRAFDGIVATHGAAAFPSAYSVG